MFEDRLETDFCCSDCNEYFESASDLLFHFALHVSEVVYLNKTFTDTRNADVSITKNNTNKEAEYENCKKNNLFQNAISKKQVPDLYPIKMVKKKISNLNKHINNVTVDRVQNYVVESMKNFTKTKNIYSDLYKQNIREHNKCTSVGNNENTSLDLDEEFNPLKYCSITMEEKEYSAKLEKSADKNKKKKYPCSFCPKLFGWSTDLKRHILTHTGERPFKCKLCNANFTRNFLLQKHEMKIHYNKRDWKSKKHMRVPNLKPLFTKVNERMKDSNKQEKEKKRKHSFAAENDVSNVYKKGLCEILRTHLNLVSTETTVQ